MIHTTNSLFNCCRHHHRRNQYGSLLCCDWHVGDNCGRHFFHRCDCLILADHSHERMIKSRWNLDHGSLRKSSFSRNDHCRYDGCRDFAHGGHSLILSDTSGHRVLNERGHCDECGSGRALHRSYLDC